MNYKFEIFKGFVDIVIKNSSIESIDFRISDYAADEYCTFVVESYNDVCYAIESTDDFDGNFIVSTVMRSLSEYITNSEIDHKPEFPEFIYAVTQYIKEISKIYTLDE